MSILDLILIFLLFLFAVRGFFKGLFRESFSLLGLFTGFLVAVQFYESASALWQSYWKVSPVISKAIIFFALFFAVYFAFYMTGRSLHRSAKMIFLAGLNRVGGILLGAGKGAAVLALILFLMGSSPVISKKMRQRVDDSVLASPLYRFGQGLVEVGKGTIFSHLEAGKNDDGGSGSA
ncbi:MAG: CvpA family protein [Candidatus Binatia bacterium]